MQRILWRAMIICTLVSTPHSFASIVVSNITSPEDAVEIVSGSYYFGFPGYDSEPLYFSPIEDIGADGEYYWDRANYYSDNMPSLGLVGSSTAYHYLSENSFGYNAQWHFRTWPGHDASKQYYPTALINVGFDIDIDVPYTLRVYGNLPDVLVFTDIVDSDHSLVFLKSDLVNGYQDFDLPAGNYRFSFQREYNNLADGVLDLYLYKTVPEASSLLLAALPLLGIAITLAKKKWPWLTQNPL